MTTQRTPDGVATRMNSGSPNLPGGCDSIVETMDMSTLLLISKMGNRATRREAARKLKKLAKARLIPAPDKETGTTVTKEQAEMMPTQVEVTPICGGGAA